MCCTLLAENSGRKKLPFWHHCTTLSGCIFAAEACINNQENLLNIDTSSTCPHNMVNFCLLTAEICWRVWGTPSNFNGFRVLAALLHGTLVWASAKLCGVEQRAPPIFGRATITLGIGPHSSSTRHRASTSILTDILRSRYVATATQPVHRLQIRPKVHN